MSVVEDAAVGGDDAVVSVLDPRRTEALRDVADGIRVVREEAGDLADDFAGVETTNGRDLDRAAGDEPVATADQALSVVGEAVLVLGLVGGREVEVVAVVHAGVAEGLPQIVAVHAGGTWLQGD